jgi:hypothetical protein
VKIGANLDGIADWSYSNVFADLMKQSRTFGTPSTPWTGKIQLDAQGWPKEDFGVVLATWPGVKNVGGTYKIQFQCQALPKILPVSSPGTISNEKRDPKSGVVTADLIYPATGSGLMLSFTNTLGGVRHLKVMRPGYKPTDLFTKPFLAHCQRFSNFRFMDWAATNGSPIKTWSERTVPSSPSYSGAANAQVPWEVCLELCNADHRDAWLNVPHQADDAYVRSLAKLVHKRLNPGLHVYVEYSNEVWNWGFAQATWNKNQALAEVKAGDPDLNFDRVNDPNVYTARRIAKRIKTISDIFRKEYGEANWSKTVRPVLAAQIAWPDYWLRAELTFLNDRFGPPNNYLYACSGAPYFNLGEADKRTDLTKEQVLQALAENVKSQTTDLAIETCATLARFYNLNFVGYEGGSDTFGPNNIAAKKAASLDPAMQKITEDYLHGWFGYGFDLLNWFVAGATNYDSPYGTWGLTNDMTNQTAPKIKGVDRVLAQATVKLTRGIPVPGKVDPRQFASRDAKWLSGDKLQLSAKDWRGPYRDYFLRFTKAGSLMAELAYRADQDVKLEIWIDNRLSTTMTLSAQSHEAVARLAPLNAGMHALRLKLAKGNAVTLEQLEIR